MNLSELFAEFIDHQYFFFEDIQKRRRLRSVPGIDFSQLYESVLTSSPVFVLSTGRSGTMWLTRLLELAPNFKVHHEPLPELGFAAPIAHSNPTNIEHLKGIFLGGRYELIREAYLLNKHYIETNNRVTFLAPAIYQLFPNAKFIHLIRSPHKFVASGMSRGWYTKNVIHDDSRPVPPAELKLSQEQKILWLWNQTNQFIEQFSSSLPAKQFVTVKSEDIFSNSKLAAQLMFDFCGAQGSAGKAWKRQFGKRINEGRSNSLNTKVVLKKEDIEILAPLSKQYGY